MANDPYLFNPGVTNPARSATTITPSDSTDLFTIPKALYVGGAGNLVVKLLDDATTVTFAVQAGAILPVRPVRVYSTGTTATGIIGLN